VPIIATVPRLDAERVSIWRRWWVAAAHIERRLDLQLMEAHGLSLHHFEVLSSLRAAGGSMRVHQLCADLGDVPSSLSRRLDRMTEAGLVTRAATPSAEDARAVTVSITREGRELWRDANITFRGVLQRHFAQSLTDTDIVALTRVLGKL
jgi:DNA-binding MarR family transcriptional regulator